mgnify:CR=1 FL=1
MKRLLIKIIPKWLKNSAVKDYLFFKIIVDEFNKWLPPDPSDEDYGILTNLIIVLLWFLKGIIMFGSFGIAAAFVIISFMIPTVIIGNYFGSFELGLVIGIPLSFFFLYLLGKLFKTKSNKSKK